MSKLALLGGVPVRTKPFMSRPYIGDEEGKYIAECLKEKTFSRFIGSPVKGFREHLALTSVEAADLKDFWSVLGGKYVRLFEKEFATKHDVAFAVSMNSATSCLTAALIACGLKPGDEVITTPLSFTATATAGSLMGAHVKFADVDAETYCLDARSLERAITDKTRAVLPVHLLGNAGNIMEIAALCRQKGIVLIEDSAQALHSKRGGKFLGTFGDVGVFSFGEPKNIVTGEGGMAITNNPELAYRLRLIRNHGEAMVFESDPPDRIEAALGYNYRLPEMLAAMGYAQAQRLKQVNDIRKENYYVLREGLGGFSFLKFQHVTNDEGKFYPYCVGLRFDQKEFGTDRNLFAQALRAEGVPVSTGFPRLLNENLLYKNAAKTPVAKKLNTEEYLGFFQIGYPNTAEDMQDIVAAVKKLSDCRKDLQMASDTIGQSREYDSGRK